ncbi:MAG: amidohydrolase family protein, partial [Nitrososphaerota archaeon]
KRIWWLESFLKPEHIYLSAKAAILLMAKNGITTFADHYFYEEEVARAVDETGVRGVLAKAVVDYSEHAPKHTIEDSVEFARRFNNEAGGRIKTMIGVHSMYSCSIETLEKAVQYSEETGLRIHMHFAESSHEIEYLKSRYGVTPAQLALQLGIMRTKPLLAHATYLTDGDIEYLAGHEVYVAYSPFTIMNWGQGVARVGELINRGVTVSLATDGPVTDGDLSLFKQMKVAMAAQSSRYSTPTKLSPNTVLEMATKNAAKSLGLQEQLGSLEPGLRADIIVLKPDKIKAIGLLEDPYTTVVYNLSEESISDVYVDGRKIVSNGRFTGIDQRKLYKQLLKLRKKLLDEAA